MIPIARELGGTPRVAEHEHLQAVHLEEGDDGKGMTCGNAAGVSSLVGDAICSSSKNVVDVISCF